MLAEEEGEGEGEEEDDNDDTVQGIQMFNSKCTEKY
jgi:hypothetical protein